MNENKIFGFRDLRVYQKSFKLALIINIEIIPLIKNDEQYDLVHQLKRSSKAIPTLIAEGYAKKDQQKGFARYLTDALSECNETIVHLSFCLELRDSKQSKQKISLLIKEYDQIGKQIYCLRKSWTKYHISRTNS